jgi:pimeloyl-ACP methyl ester carboxylesterase
MVTETGKLRREEVLRKIKSNPRGLHVVLTDPDIVAKLRADAAENGEDAIIPASILEDYLRFAEIVDETPNRLQAAGGSPVLVVPGFLGSSLSDTTGGNELIWIDPTLAFDGTQLSALQLAPRTSSPDQDLVHGVTIVPSGAVPLAYSLLMWRLSFAGYAAEVFPFDWRKDLEESGRLFAQRIRDVAAAAGNRKVKLIAHSQGSLVARYALNLLGKTETERLVDMLVLLGPASYGTFTAAMAISGSHNQLQLFQNWAINAPSDVAAIFQSMSGLYQLLPWDRNHFPTNGGQPLFDVASLKRPDFWKTGVDRERLNLWGWAEKVDTSFFSSQMRIILGQDASTAAAVEFQGGKLVVTKSLPQGDGVVLDVCAKIPGVRTFRATGAKHAWMASTFNVTGAVLNLFGGNDPRLMPGLAGHRDSDVIGVIPPEHVPSRPVLKASPKGPVTNVPVAIERLATINAEVSRVPPSPDFRRLKVFTLDPFLMSDPATADLGVMELQIPWEGLGRSEVELLPGPVGEYLEVVDVDPQSGRFYFPVDLNHPHVLSERGLTPVETNPQFHQQMVYGVSMATIRVFESALGRTALWSQRFVTKLRTEAKNDETETGAANRGAADRFVRRLRIYPHAMRQRNAYYDPERKALLFGYFPSQTSPGALVKPGATVFTCLSFDIVAHETTHALVDGLHRYFNTPSNPDVFAFHEAFADAVALLQRFSNQDLMQRQMRACEGKLIHKNSLLGQLARQFGEASGVHGGLRQYLGTFDPENGEARPTKPAPEELAKETQPHKRGAMLVAAMFQALNSMYEQRSSDLLDIARRENGTIVFSRELEARLAREAAHAAEDLLQMCIRALDYVPPVDISFGDYLCGLITADIELVHGDRYHDRASIVNAFSQWGIYPSEKKTLVPDDLRWQGPSEIVSGTLIEWLQANSVGDWTLGADRAEIFHQSERLARSLHRWIRKFAPDQPSAYHREFGLDLSREGNNKSIGRDARGVPKFEVHSVRPCRRVSPDGQVRRTVVIEIVQRRKAFFDESIQAQVDAGAIAFKSAREDFYFRGGCTLIVDGETGQVRYLIRKSITNQDRLRAEREFRGGTGPNALAANYFQFRLGDEFRLMHADE